MYRILLFGFLLFMMACGTQKNLQKSYVGKDLSFLKDSFGNPKTVFDRGEEKVYIFEKNQELRSTEVNQGKLSLDPMISPSVTKTERYYFTLKDGKVIKVKLEEEYER